LINGIFPASRQPQKDFSLFSILVVGRVYAMRTASANHDLAIEFALVCEERKTFVRMRNPENLRPAHPDQTVVLVVDDDVMVQNVVRIVLDNEGYFVLTAENGEEALYISRQYPGLIHLVVSDVKMPRMDGFALKSKLQRSGPILRCC